MSSRTKVHYGTATAAILTVSATPGNLGGERLRTIYGHFSASYTGDVTVTYNSAQGSTYDTLIKTLQIVGVTDFVWSPDEEIVIGPGDAIDVVAPSGGGGVVATISIVAEVIP